MAVKIGTVKINKAALMDAVGSAPGMLQFFTQAARQAATVEMLLAKDQTLEFFDEHPVTQEIKAGPYTEDSVLSYGNLFGLLGFDEGSDPTEDLREALEDKIDIAFEPSKYVNARLGIYRYYFNVLGPDRKEIKDYTKDALSRWSTADSWVYQIEEGVSNLNKYLHSRSRTFPQSASGPAIQVKHELREAEGFKMNYLTDVLNFLRKTLNS